MPPSREFTLSVDDEMKRRLEKELGLKASVSIKVRQVKSGRTLGYYDPPFRRITIELGWTGLTHTRLTLVSDSVLQTLLHEYRHVHQFDTWKEDRLLEDYKRQYHLKEIEKDANEFAQTSAKRYRGLARVVPKKTRGPLSKLSTTEKTLR